jgi:hypothetical protein
MAVVAKMDEFLGKGGWIAAMVLAFIVHWPIGLAILAFLIFSGRFRAWKHGHAPGRWYNQAEGGAGRNGGCAWTWNWGGGPGRGAPTSGNRAFDEYRAETLKRLEEEQREFVDYLERLRKAKDKAEFDQFMAERRGRPTPPTETNVTDV